MLNSTHLAEAATDVYKKEIMLFEKNVTVIVKIEYSNEKENTSKKRPIKSPKSSDTHVTYNQTQNNVTVISDQFTNVEQKNNITNQYNEQVINQTNINQEQVNIKSNTHVSDVAEKIEVNDKKTNNVTKSEDKDSKIKLLNQYLQDGETYKENDQEVTKESFSINLQDLEVGKIHIKDFN